MLDDLPRPRMRRIAVPLIVTGLTRRGKVVEGAPGVGCPSRSSSTRRGSSDSMSRSTVKVMSRGTPTLLVRHHNCSSPRDVGPDAFRVHPLGHVAVEVLGRRTRTRLRRRPTPFAAAVLPEEPADCPDIRTVLSGGGSRTVARHGCGRFAGGMTLGAMEPNLLLPREPHLGRSMNTSRPGAGRPVPRFARRERGGALGARRARPGRACAGRGRRGLPRPGRKWRSVASGWRRARRPLRRRENGAEGEPGTFKGPARCCARTRTRSSRGCRWRRPSSERARRSAAVKASFAGPRSRRWSGALA